MEDESITPEKNISVKKLLGNWAKNMLDPNVSDEQRKKEVRKDYKTVVDSK